jgi:hypothetical protein
MDRKELEQIGRLFAHQTVLRMILAEISMTTPDPARWIAKNTQGGGGAIKADHSATKLKYADALFIKQAALSTLVHIFERSDVQPPED